MCVCVCGMGAGDSFGWVVSLNDSVRQWEVPIVQVCDSCQSGGLQSQLSPAGAIVYLFIYFEIQHATIQ